MLTVHWGGEGSDVVVCLARNPTQSADASSSVFVSYDYGRTFVRKVMTEKNYNLEVYFILIQQVHITFFSYFSHLGPPVCATQWKAFVYWPFL